MLSSRSGQGVFRPSDLRCSAARDDGIRAQCYNLDPNKSSAAARHVSSVLLAAPGARLQACMGALDRRSAPGDRHSTLRALLAMLAAKECEVHVADATDAFLSVGVEEDVAVCACVAHPRGFKTGRLDGGGCRRPCTTAYRLCAHRSTWRPPLDATARLLANRSPSSLRDVTCGCKRCSPMARCRSCVPPWARCYKRKRYTQRGATLARRSCTTTQPDRCCGYTL